MSGLSWRKFLPYNCVGGLVWASVVALLGYLAGASLAVAQERLGQERLGMAGDTALGVVAVVGLLVWLRSHVRRRRAEL